MALNVLFSKTLKKVTTNDCMDAGGRATQEQLPRHEGHEDLIIFSLKLRALRVFVVNIFLPNT